MKLYLILKHPEKDPFSGYYKKTTMLESWCTHSLEDVSKALSEKDVEVYKFGELTRIMEVEVTYQEKPEELT